MILERNILNKITKKKVFSSYKNYFWFFEEKDTNNFFLGFLIEESFFYTNLTSILNEIDNISDEYKFKLLKLDDKEIENNQLLSFDDFLKLDFLFSKKEITVKVHIIYNGKSY